MGKKEDEQARSNILEEVIEQVRGGREHLLRIAEALVHDGEPGIAGRVFVMAERLRVGAMDLRIDFLGEAPAAATLPAPEPKPKRVRGPRKRRESAAARTLPVPGTEPSDDELERLTAPNGAS